MVKFRTEFPEFNLPKIDYLHPILIAGSCFAELIEVKLNAGGLLCIPPSHGILYNPFSLATMLQSWCETPPNWPILEEYKQRWISLEHHGTFSDENRVQAEDNITKARNLCAKALPHSQLLFLSLGTAHYFEDKNSGKPVANCHKLPASRFIRKRATVEGICESMQRAFDDIWKANANLNIILSISPVKHLRDGLIENSLSKSILNVAVHELCTSNLQVHYFPAFEILVEDLRDYRFYTEDLAHPSKSAQDYIFTYFKNACFSREVSDIYTQMIDYYNLKRHSPINNPGLHLEQIQKQRAHLISLYPFLEARLV